MRKTIRNTYLEHIGFIIRILFDKNKQFLNLHLLPRRFLFIKIFNSTKSIEIFMLRKFYAQSFSDRMSIIGLLHMCISFWACMSI